MEYTINQLATLSGVSTRTLRYYDEINLLKPEKIADNGYRIYGQVQVDTLQQILFYRELGIKLEEIANIIYAKDFDKAKSLQKHLVSLIEKKERIELLIQNVNKSILSLKGDTIMTDEEKFEGFKEDLIAENERKYGHELREKYGDDVMIMSNQKFSDLTQEEWQIQKALSHEIASLLKAAVKNGNPNCEEAQKACDLHRQWLCMFWPEETYSKEAHKNLGEAYVADSRFKEYYDKITPGCAEFFKVALTIYCTK